MANGLIGYTGFIGSVLAQQMQFTHLYNTANIDSIRNMEFDTLVCAAPTGNRLYAAQNPVDDLNNITRLISILQTVKVNKFILIGTIDAVSCIDSDYGANRRLFQDFVKSHYSNYHILRLCTLIHKDIKKNVLYDLAHDLYLEKINPESTLQWYPLNNLKADIDKAVSMNISEQTLVSEPIQNKEIIDKFFKTKTVGAQPSKLVQYTLTPISYTKEDIFKEISDYLK